MTVPYTAEFYSSYRAESYGSAQVVVPLVLDLLRPSSVVDVGCGVGTWLQVFSECGIADIQGIDGAYVNVQQLCIEAGKFKAHDLRKPLSMSRQYDLATSVEVAEHLPAPSAEQFVSSLCGLAPAVMFSAAIPFQGGDDHINEQWPEYWAALFASRGYVAYDVLRPLLWNNPSVAYYYAQNLLLFVRADAVESYAGLRGLRPCDGPLARVHPRRWLQAHDPRRQRVPPLLRALPFALSRAVSLRAGRLARRIMRTNSSVA
jgi:SAM-dependent methyltransferase